jgi:hypothetical protein
MGIRMMTALAVAVLVSTALAVPSQAKQYAPAGSQELARPALEASALAVPHRLSFWPSINWSKVANNGADDWLNE